MAGGARLFEGLQPWAPKLTQMRAVDAPGVTHIKDSVGRIKMEQGLRRACLGTRS